MRESKEKLVGAKVTKDFYKRVQKAATKTHENVSEYVRRIIAEALEATNGKR